jgi:hypothetical protein
MAFPVPQALPPRGEVNDGSLAERRPQALRPVNSIASAPTPETQPEQTSPSLEGSIEPQKIVKLKAAPPVSTPSAKQADDENPTDPRPPAGAGKTAARPSLKRIK